MKIKFFGVRGSTPEPGPTTTRYGGNTSCVYVTFDNGASLILDAGTAIRSLGYQLTQNDQPIYLVLSHNHWDHIQGYPFFVPIYQPGREINVFPSISSGRRMLSSLFDQMDGNSFPLHADDLPSHNNMMFRDVESVMAEKQVMLVQKPLNHPGGGSSYKMVEDGVSCAYVTDNELEPPNKVHTSYDEWVEYLSIVDVLIHDAQYTQDDMSHKHGWGHSLVSQVRQLAVDAEVGALVMFQHDPDRTDGEIEEIRLGNESFFSVKRAPARSFCAWEGLELELKKPVAGGATILRQL